MEAAQYGVCIRVHVYVCAFTCCLCAYMFICVCMCVCICVSVYIRVLVDLCVHLCVCGVSVYACMCVHVFMCAHRDMCVLFFYSIFYLIINSSYCKIILRTWIPILTTKIFNLNKTYLFIHKTIENIYIYITYRFCIQILFHITLCFDSIHTLTISRMYAMHSDYLHTSFSCGSSHPPYNSLSDIHSVFFLDPLVLMRVIFVILSLDLSHWNLVSSLLDIQNDSLYPESTSSK